MIDFKAIASKITGNFLGRFGTHSGDLNKWLNMDYEKVMKLNKQELKEINQKFNKEMTRRIRRLNNSRYSSDSPALQNINERGKPERTKNMTLNQERNFFIEVRSFMLNKTSTVAGTKKLVKYYDEKFGKSYNELSDKAKNDFWELYNKYSELNPGITQIKGGTNVAQKIAYRIFKLNYGKWDNDVLEGMIRSKLDDYYNDKMGF